LLTVVLWVLSILILGSAHHASPVSERGDLLFMLGIVIWRSHRVTDGQFAGIRGGTVRMLSR
jgi:hypothetical protein